MFFSSPQYQPKEKGMNQAEALSVVRSLANGVDPESGEVVPADSV